MISLNVNGKTYSLDVPPDLPLLWAIRDGIGLTGTIYSLMAVISSGTLRNTLRRRRSVVMSRN